jgi:hypothetical protein
MRHSGIVVASAVLALSAIPSIAQPVDKSVEPQTVRMQAHKVALGRQADGTLKLVADGLTFLLTDPALRNTGLWRASGQRMRHTPTQVSLDGNVVISFGPQANTLLEVKADEAVLDQQAWAQPR